MRESSARIQFLFLPALSRHEQSHTMAAPAAAASVDVTSLPVIRVGGVPEHFNLPWQLAQEVSASSSDEECQVAVTVC